MLSYYLMCIYKENSSHHQTQIFFQTFEITGEIQERTCFVSEDDVIYNWGEEVRGGQIISKINHGLVKLVSTTFDKERVMVGIIENGKSSISYFSVPRDNLDEIVSLENR